MRQVLNLFQGWSATEHSSPATNDQNVNLYEMNPVRFFFGVALKGRKRDGIAAIKKHGRRFFYLFWQRCFDLTVCFSWADSSSLERKS